MKLKTAPFVLAAVVCALALTVACGDDEDGDGGGGGDTLGEVQDRDSLSCGVKDSQPGFGNLEADGSYSGNDIEFCKALAAAVFGDPAKVEYVPASAQDRFELLNSGEIDVLIRTTSMTSGRDIDLELTFAPTTFYDGQGFIVAADADFDTLESLEGASICVTGGTTTEQNLSDGMAQAGVEYSPLTFEDDAAIQAAFVEGRCDAWTGDRSNLTGQVNSYPASAGGPEALTILPMTISKEPLGPVVREGDDDWNDIVTWVVYGLIAAEELGVNSSNVADMAASPPNAETARLLGVGFDGGEVTAFGTSLGLEATFMQDVLTAVGNYGEIYDRTIEPIGLPREGSPNDLWTRGGLMYAPPIRGQ